jgi:Cu2+-exporting ATPase
LARNGVILIEYFLEDEVRQGGRDAIEQLKSLGVEVKLASGDKLDSVTTTATYLGIEDFKSECTPEEKYQWLLSLQKMGRRVMMVGDGLNDVPVIGAANVSVAMASGAGLARCHADVIVMDERLDAFPEMIRFARRTQQKIIQNLAWALGYNALALPLAVMGFVPPWAAAIGMSASSLVVVLNALRLSR